MSGVAVLTGMPVDLPVKPDVREDPVSESCAWFLVVSAGAVRRCGAVEFVSRHADCGFWVSAVDDGGARVNPVATRTAEHALFAAWIRAHLR